MVAKYLMVLALVGHLGVACQPAPMASFRARGHRFTQPNGLRFTSNGRYLVAHSDFGVRIFEVPSGRIRGTSTIGHAGGLTLIPVGMDVSPDGRRVAFVRNGTLQVARVPDGKQECDASLSSSEGVVAFSPSGERLVIAHTMVETWEVPTLRRTALAAVRFLLINAIAFSPDGRTLALGGVTSIAAGPRIELWDAEKWTLRDSLTLRSGDRWVNSVVFSRDGRYLASGAGPLGTLTLWNLMKRGEVWHRALPGYLTGGSLAFSPDGRWLVVGEEKGKAMILDSRNGGTALEWSAHEGRADVYALAISSDGHRLVTSGSREIRLWDFDRLVARASARSR